jgi:hypothetical protein
MEVDHVLEFVHERHRNEALHLVHGMRAAQRPVRIRHDGVEDLGVVSLARHQVGTEEVASHEALGAAVGRGDELIHLVGHQYDHHTVVVDVRFAAERRCVHLVQQRVKHVAQRAQVRAAEPVRRFGAVHKDRDVEPDLLRDRPDGNLLFALEVGTDTEAASGS